MRITIDLDTDDAADLAGLTALIAALGGGQAKGEPLVIKYRTDVPAVPPPPAPEVPDVPESERLLQALADSRQAADDETPNANAPATDSRGYPWDERIHASTKAVNGDGTWRNKRGVDKTLLAQVEAEMLAAVGVATGPGAPPADEPLAGDPATPSDPAAALGTPGATVPPPPPAPGSLAEQMAAVAAASKPSVPPPPPPAETPAPAGDITFPAILKLAETKDKTFEELTALARQLGLDKFQDLVRRPDLFESFVAALG